jgi:hypothetical protein
VIAAKRVNVRLIRSPLWIIRDRVELAASPAKSAMPR